MKKVIIFDTSVASFNRGDDIIMKGAREGLEEILSNSFVTNFPTHTPIFHYHQTSRINQNVKWLQQADLKFVCGSNLLYSNMVRPWPLWNINFLDSIPIKDCVLVGVGSGINSKGVNFYTKKLYKSVLSSEYVHSVRDNSTKLMLEKMGFKAINTGCPTLWNLTSDLCKQIPTKKSDSVIFTLTDYRRDKSRDQKMIEILIKNYKTVRFWPQGSEDYNYFQSMSGIDSIQVISPSVEAFSNALNSDTDYVGTRLHGGIFAMKHKQRSIIIIVDHRAREMNKDFNLKALERDNIEELEKLINSEFPTEVTVDREKINSWLNQFK